MMDATTNDKVIDYADDRLMLKVLQSDELMPNIFLCIVAGYETASTALAYSTYILATRPVMQDKIIEEINHHNWNNNNNNNAEEIYETAHNLSYSLIILILNLNTKFKYK
ncbi:unnamed protein product, partial [Rotaria sordida]